jgi:hypothetical protein
LALHQAQGGVEVFDALGSAGLAAESEAPEEVSVLTCWTDLSSVWPVTRAFCALAAFRAFTLSTSAVPLDDPSKNEGLVLAGSLRPRVTSL